LDIAILAGELLKTLTAYQGKIASVTRNELQPPSSIDKRVVARHRSRAGDMLIARQGQAHRKQAGLIEERLVPANVRRRLPARLVVIGQHRQPIGQESDPVPVAPAPILVWQFQDELYF
jgi:hypothetical protein